MTANTSTRRIVILGGGTGGTLTANRLRRHYKHADVHITVVDQDDHHIYQPGLLFIPFGLAHQQEIVRPRQHQLHKDIEFVQKGIDMRIGLDIATYAASDRIDRLGLVTADTDLVPALKHARRAGLQVTIYELPGQRLHRDLIEHADIRRVLAWP